MTALGVLLVLTSACGNAPPSSAQGDTAAEGIEKARQALQDPELAQRDPDRVRNEIQLLGRLRAVQAIPDLIKLLGFRYRYRWEREGGPRVMRPASVSRYPATDALVEIGKPALSALLEVVETRGFDSIESRNARYAIRWIFRDEPSKADELFNGAAAKASTPEGKQRLLKALETAHEDWKSD
jgi:hypothetical protein